jgi:pimeloyl-ACP methyl ester carboxylesterase
MASIDLPHGVVHYRVAGLADSPAPPVLFIHPFLMDGSLWSGVADLLAARGIRSYAPDWPLGAHRAPVNPGTDQSPRGIARQVLAFIEALELRDVTLVGGDTGGALCQFLLDTDASRIGRVVLTNCDAFDVFPPFPFNVVFSLLKGVGRMKMNLQPMRWRAFRHSPLGMGCSPTRSTVCRPGPGSSRASRTRRSAPTLSNSSKRPSAKICSTCRPGSASSPDQSLSFGAPRTGPTRRRSVVGCSRHSVMPSSWRFPTPGHSSRWTLQTSSPTSSRRPRRLGHERRNRGLPSRRSTDTVMVSPGERPCRGRNRHRPCCDDIEGVNRIASAGGDAIEYVHTDGEGPPCGSASWPMFRAPPGVTLQA